MRFGAALFILAAAISTGTSLSAAVGRAASQNQTVVTFKADETIPAEIRRAAFLFVWETIRDKYFDPTYGGKDWNEIKARYEPRVGEAETSEAFHSLLRQMVEELGRSHLAIIAPHQRPGGTAANSKVQMAPEGLSVGLVEGRVLLAAIKPDTPAWNAGLRPGYVVVSVGDAVLPTTEEIRASSLRAATAARLALAGEPSSMAVLTVLDENDREKTVSVPRTAAFQKSANLGRSKFEYRRIRPRVGYLWFDGWAFDLKPKLEAALKDLWDTDGLIIDCRQNHGGVNPGVDYLSSALCPEPGILAIETSREGDRREWRHEGSGPNAYRGRVVILVDGGSGSASEVFAAAMQETGRARIAGESSFGGVLNSTQAVLPTGGILQYPHSDMRTGKGNSIEGRGVIPDIPVSLSRGDLLQSRDTVIERAVSAILSGS